MNKHIFLIPLLIIALGACQKKTSQQPVSAAQQSPHEQPSESSPQAAPATTESGALQQRLQSLGFQTPTADLPAMDFVLEDLLGNELSLSSFQGQVVLLNFWATWCGPCKIEIPSMEELYSEMQGQGFVILAVNSQEARDQVARFVQDNGMSFPVVLDSTGRIGATYSVRAIPTTYIINPQGYILGRMVGTREWYTTEIVELIEDLLL